jgi:hypothetical protein
MRAETAGEIFLPRIRALSTLAFAAMDFIVLI